MYITLKEAAEKYNVTITAIRYHIKKNKIKNKIKRNPGTKPIIIVNDSDVKSSLDVEQNKDAN